MPKKCPKFVSDYLIPSLNTGRFGKHLKWVDKKNAVFQIEWSHKSGPTWSKEEAEVFVEWDRIKGHYQPEDQGYYTRSKQRFRALLYKLTCSGEIKEVKNEHKFKKIFSIGEKKQKRKKRNMISSDTVFDSSTEEETFFEDMHTNAMENISDINKKIYELEDHNYSKFDDSSNSLSVSEDQTQLSEDTAASSFLDDVSENFEKKVLVERNYPFPVHDMMLDCDVQTDYKNGTAARIDGAKYIRYNLGRTVFDPTCELTSGYVQKNIDENKMPNGNFGLDYPIQLLNTESSNFYFNSDDLLGSNSEEFIFSLLKLV